MPFQVYASQVYGRDFTGEVETYRKAMMDHRFTEGVAPPMAPPFVEGCIRRVPVEGAADEFVADYEIVDNIPPPPSLEDKKRRLISAVLSDEQTAIAKIIPHGKARLWGIEVSEAAAVEPGKRGKQHIAILDAARARNEKITAIQTSVAKVLSDIEDLTEKNVDAWRAPPIA